MGNCHFAIGYTASEISIILSTHQRQFRAFPFIRAA